MARTENGEHGRRAVKPAAVIVALAGVLAVSAAAQDDAVVTGPLRGLRGPVAALLATGAESGSWPAALAAWPHDDRLLFVVDAATAGRDAEELEVYAYATDAAGRVVGFVAEAVPVPADADGVRFVGAARRPAGEGSLRVLVVEPRTLRGYRLLIATVADGAPTPPLASPPGRWTLARLGADTPDGDLLDVTVDGRPLAERLRESAGVPPAMASPEAAPPSVDETDLPDARKRRARALSAMARRGYRVVLDRLATGVGAAAARAAPGLATRVAPRAPWPVSTDTTTGVPTRRKAGRHDETAPADPDFEPRGLARDLLPCICGFRWTSTLASPR